jgi:hypothetical protein
MFVFSALTVTFSYMLAEIIYVVVQMGELDSHATFSVKDLEATAVVVTPWPSAVVSIIVLEMAGIGLLGVACIAELRSLRKLITFLGAVACAIALIAGTLLGFSTALMILEVLLSKVSASGLSSADVPPVPFVVTAAVTVGLFLGLAKALPEVREASAKAFGSR